MPVPRARKYQIVMHEWFERKHFAEDVNTLYVQAQIDILNGFWEIRI